MHTDTLDTRTQFLATPQFGFAHLRGSRTPAEPIHDFLVVHFGAVAGIVATACGAHGVAMGARHAEDRP